MQIRDDSLEECIKLYQIIPEVDSPYKINEYEKRCDGINHLYLMGDIPVGFKISYDHYKDGVIPNFRRNGVAHQLSNFQESCVENDGYLCIRMKTRKKHKSMIKISLKRGFLIKDKIPIENLLETRIIMGEKLG